MKIITKSIFFFLISLLLSFQIVAQEKNQRTESKKGLQQLSLFMSHSHIAAGASDAGGKEWIVVPSWGLDYNYWISAQWAIGVHSDMMIQSFKVKEGNEAEGSTIERTRPIAILPVVVFKPKEHSSFIVGLGKEFAAEGNLTLMRIGYEYGLDIGNQWELSAGIAYDLKFNAYDTWILGLGISRSFRFKK